MKRIYTTLLGLSMAASIMAQGWPAGYGGVMLQGFYWNSFNDSKWTKLEKQADDLATAFDLIWIPQSGKCIEDNQVMGYTPYYYFNQNSSFGTEAELRSMIKTFKAKGIGTVADVVINHHNTSGWYSFPAETYNGVTYQFQSTDITANDDGGATKTQAAKDGVSLSANNDEGEDWSGCRDLDHKSENVQTIIKAYVKYLKDDLGYTGFRYDMVKGFSGSHVADYNDAAGIEYSVGEYWDSNSKIENWINATSKKSAAFDFQFRYNVRDAINNGDWSKLNSTNNLMHDANYRRYAVTFVENHDMEYRSSSEQQDPIKKDTLAANAYLLAMPGTPCVFMKHWQAYTKEIKQMINARKMAGINNESNYTNLASSAAYYTNAVFGKKGILAVVVGNQSAYNGSALTQYTKVMSGYHYAYYLQNTMNTVWVDQPSGNYDNAIAVTFTAVTSDASAKMVYTTDGSTPTASSKAIANGGTLSIAANTTLTVGLLINGSVTGIVSRTYTFDKEQFEPYNIKVYVNAEQAGWNTSTGLNYHTWGGDGTHGTNWPGAKVTTTESVNGKTWFVNSYPINTDDDYVSFVWSVGTGSPQTIDVTGVTQTSFFEITNEKSASGNYKVNDVTTANGIADAITEQPHDDSHWYTINGLRLNQLPTQKGIYIHNGKKVIVR